MFCITAQILILKISPAKNMALTSGIPSNIEKCDFLKRFITYTKSI
jgi:hypothetical protein